MRWYKLISAWCFEAGLLLGVKAPEGIAELRFVFRSFTLLIYFLVGLMVWGWTQRWIILSVSGVRVLCSVAKLWQKEEASCRWDNYCWHGAKRKVLRFIIVSTEVILLWHMYVSTFRFITELSKYFPMFSPRSWFICVLLGLMEINGWHVEISITIGTLLRSFQIRNGTGHEYGIKCNWKTHATWLVAVSSAQHFRY